MEGMLMSSTTADEYIASQLVLLAQYITEMREAKAACDAAGETVYVQGYVVRIENIIIEIRNWLPYDEVVKNRVKPVCDTADNLFSSIGNEGDISPANDAQLTAMANFVRQMLGHD